MNAQYSIGDIVIGISSDRAQTDPLSISHIQNHNDKNLYCLAGNYYEQVMPGNRLTWMLIHLRLNWSVVPVIAGGKKPLVSWKQFQKSLPTEDLIKQWWKAFKDPNHAIVCGEVSGLIVLDIDSLEGEKYAKEHGLPKTPIATTGKGRHLYFRHPGEPVDNFVHKVPGLDLRGDGGYIVAPGSWHAEAKKTYRWTVSPWDMALADMPAWLLDLTKEKIVPSLGAPVQNDRYVEKALENELGKLACAVKDYRNDQLNRSAHSLGQFVGAGALDENEVTRLLSNVAHSIGLEEDEIEPTIRSGIEAGKKEPRQIPEAPTKLPPLPSISPSDATSEIASLREQQEKTWLSGEEQDFTDRVKDVIEKSAGLTEAQIDNLLDEIERGPNPLVGRKRVQLKRLWRETNKGAQILQAVAVREQMPLTWPYEIKNGHIRYLYEHTFQGVGSVRSAPVCDFEARITEQITDEDGERSFKISGKSVRGGPFEVTMLAEDFGSDSKLKAVLDAASGGKDPVRAGMSKHLAPAIQLLTKDEMKEMKRYTRTGWQSQAHSAFLIPGRERPGIIIQLPRKLPYSISQDADLHLGIKALENLIECIEPERTTVLISAIFQAPLMRLLPGWGNERYGIFVSGRTGSFKTSICQVAMSIYGPSFMHDDLLVKWGEGATSNAMMGLAVHASDMPFLIDNFKPSTGGGVRSFIGLIHNIVEGSEKDRLNRASKLRDARPVFCLPICTGEDVPDSDAASLVRILIIPLPWQRGQDNPKLTVAQELSAHLCALGKAWLTWLESEEGQLVARRIASAFPKRRSWWSDKLSELRRDAVNIQRVASNLATNELTWKILAEHPQLGAIAKKYQDNHAVGLAEIVAIAMAEATAESLEAMRFLAAMRELLTTGRAVLFERNPKTPFEHPLTWKDRQIGWVDEDGVYLLSASTRKKVEELIDDDLNAISSTALYKQLDEMSLIVAHNKNTLLKSIWVEGKMHKVLFLDRSVLDEG